MSEAASTPNSGKTQEIASLREDLRKAQANIRRVRDEAQHRLEHLAREFREPLTTILGFSDILSAADKSNSAEWNQIAIAGHQLMELVARIENDQSKPATGSDDSNEPEIPMPFKQTVLQIEDNEANFRLTERILEERPNIDLLWAATGQDGIDLASKHSPGLILLDLNLPDIHGSDVLARLRDNPLTRKIPVIVLSADVTPSRIEKMLQAGAQNYLTKPFDIQRLLCLVDETLAPAA